MLTQLQTTAERYEAITAALSNPQVASDPTQLARLLKEQKQLSPLYTVYTEYSVLLHEIEQNRLLQEEADDTDLLTLAQEEYKQLVAEKERLQEQAQILLLPKDPNDSQNVIVEIRAGAGGEEAALFGNTLCRMYSMFAQDEGFSVEVVSKNETELGGLKEVILSISGEGAFSRFKFESGVHRVQRVPETESGGRIHTSTVTVAVLPEVEDVEVTISPADIHIETIKSTGAGGQHVNKTESAVRLTHIPSGIVIECRQERSQFQNRDKAMRLLKARLYDQKQSAQQAEISSTRRTQVGTGDRSERIRTYNYPQGRVTDHRIGLTLYSLENILNGAIHPIVSALTMADQTEKLRQAQYEN